MAINDLYTDGIASGWDVRDASRLTAPLTLEADVAIIGSGAGGATSAEILSAAGLKVLLIEEGALKTAADFKQMSEARAYAELYQEGSGRTSSDGAITVLQGRAVGGTTVVNWTSSFRTPDETLAHWATAHGVQGWGRDDAKPWFDERSARLGIAPWGMAPNANNAVLQQACEKLGWEWHVIPRNVRGCWNSGYCGFGCPVNAKQSMLVASIPAALGQGATLVHHLRVQRLQWQGARVTGLDCVALDAAAQTPTGVAVTVRARHYVLAGGGLNNPALLLRSQAPDPHGRVGKQTCIHPAVFTYAQMPQAVDGWYGAPQSIASDHFQWQGDFGQAPGFKLEVPPIYPALIMALLGRHGAALQESAAAMPRLNVMVALVRDGFHADSIGGEVRIADDGQPLFDYELTPYLMRGFRQALLRMAEAQFAAGAAQVMPAHLDGGWATSWSAAKQQIEALDYKPFRLAVGTAHLMGGCAMGEDAKRAVADSTGNHHQLENLSINDGSLFPTSIGANPQLSIYALAARNATLLAQRLKPAA